MLVYSDWDAVADNSRSFRLYCAAYHDGFGTALEQEQPDEYVHPMFSLVAPPSTTNDLGPPSTPSPVASFGPSIISTVTSGLSRYVHTRTKTHVLENITTVTVGENNAHIQRSMKPLLAYTYMLDALAPTAS